ncbi:hypothetical protein, partial [Armatimonas sp.]|uniref:hypothetical protein n=1 Tax=Armatimonas sp. TaxID=1872638 RepID=UPI00286B2969
LVFRRFDLWLILMTVGYGADMPLAWGWILIRVLRGEKLINPITLPIDNRLCDVELTVEKIRFGVQIAVLLALLTLTRNTPIKKSDLPFCFFAGSVLLVVLFHRALQLQRQLRAWKAVGGKIGMPARQRQGYGTTEIEEGQ